MCTQWQQKNIRTMALQGKGAANNHCSKFSRVSFCLELSEDVNLAPCNVQAKIILSQSWYGEPSSP